MNHRFKKKLINKTPKGNFKRNIKHYFADETFIAKTLIPNSSGTRKGARSALERTSESPENPYKPLNRKFATNLTKEIQDLGIKKAKAMSNLSKLLHNRLKLN